MNNLYDEYSAAIENANDAEAQVYAYLRSEGKLDHCRLTSLKNAASDAQDARLDAYLVTLTADRLNFTLS